VLPGPDTIGENGAGLGWVRCCNRAATGAVHTRTEQENISARNAKNRLDKQDLPTGQYPPGGADLRKLHRYINKGVHRSVAAMQFTSLKRKYEKEYTELKAEGRGQKELL
jgi:hypothetical protein